MDWKKQIEEVPPGDMMCLAVKNNSHYITVLNWNSHYQSWDNFENDDHECDRGAVDFWIPFDELPDIPER